MKIDEVIVTKSFNKVVKCTYFDEDDLKYIYEFIDAKGNQYIHYQLKTVNIQCKKKQLEFISKTGPNPVGKYYDAKCRCRAMSIVYGDNAFYANVDEIYRRLPKSKGQQYFNKHGKDNASKI